MSNDRKKLIILLMVIILILAFALIYLNTELLKSDKKIENQISDNIRFYREYTEMPQQNVFKYADFDEIVKVLKEGTGIVFLGFPACPWCQKYAPILNEVALENDIETIYYYNIKEIRENNTSEYLELVDILSDYLSNDTNQNKRIYVPDVYFVKDGKIIGHNNETSQISNTDPEQYYTEEIRRNIKKDIKRLTDLVYTPVCDDTLQNVGC